MSGSSSVTVKTTPAKGSASKPPRVIVVRNTSDRKVHLVTSDKTNSISIMPNTTTHISGIFLEVLSKHRAIKILSN